MRDVAVSRRNLERFDAPMLPGFVPVQTPSLPARVTSSVVSKVGVFTASWGAFLALDAGVVYALHTVLGVAGVGLTIVGVVGLVAAVGFAGVAGKVSRPFRRVLESARWVQATPRGMRVLRVAAEDIQVIAMESPKSARLAGARALVRQMETLAEREHALVHDLSVEMGAKWVAYQASDDKVLFVNTQFPRHQARVVHQLVATIEGVAFELRSLGGVLKGEMRQGREVYARTYRSLGSAAMKSRPGFSSLGVFAKVPGAASLRKFHENAKAFDTRKNSTSLMMADLQASVAASNKAIADHRKGKVVEAVKAPVQMITVDLDRLWSFVEKSFMNLTRDEIMSAIQKGAAKPTNASKPASVVQANFKDLYQGVHEYLVKLACVVSERKARDAKAEALMESQKAAASVSKAEAAVKAEVAGRTAEREYLVALEEFDSMASQWSGSFEQLLSALELCSNSHVLKSMRKDVLAKRFAELAPQSHPLGLPVPVRKMVSLLTSSDDGVKQSAEWKVTVAFLKADISELKESMFTVTKLAQLLDMDRKVYILRQGKNVSFWYDLFKEIEKSRQSLAAGRVAEVNRRAESFKSSARRTATVYQAPVYSSSLERESFHNRNDDVTTTFGSSSPSSWTDPWSSSGCPPFGSDSCSSSMYDASSF